MLRVSRVEAGGEGLLLLWREWKLSHSRIPSYHCGHGGSTLISFFWTNLKESVVLFCQIKIISLFWIPQWPIFRQQLTGLWMCTLIPVWSDKASVLTGHLWELALFFCLYLLVECGYAPEWTLECHTNIIGSLLASRIVVTAGRLSSFLHPQHPFHSISAFEHRIRFGWKP